MGTVEHVSTPIDNLALTASSPVRVSSYSRAILAIFALFGIWQVAWLIHVGGVIRPLLPSPFDSTTNWAAAWGILAALAAAAAVTGRDWVARMAFAMTAITSVMGCVTVLVTDKPMDVEFWRFGMSATIAASCFVLLLSPLRVPPTHSGFPVEAGK